MMKTSVLDLEEYYSTYNKNDIFGGVFMIDIQIINYVNKFINQLNITDCIGVLVYGSYVGGRSNELSDLDVMLIKDNYDGQNCGSLSIDGLRVEFFIQGLQKIYDLIKIEIDNNDPSHLTKFATCEILYDNDGRIAEFVEYAKKLYNTEIKPSFNNEDKFSIFSINNRIEDLESLINEESFYAVYYITLEKIRILYSKINGIIELPITKIEKIYSDKNFATKYISSTIHKLPHKDFIDLYLKCIKIDNQVEMLSNLKELYCYSFSALEFDPSNFCLTFTKKAPFKV